MTTDQFTTEGVQAVFEEQEGVSLNEEKNQAYVEAISPGEELILGASVTLPEDFAQEELINMASYLWMVWNPGKMKRRLPSRNSRHLP